MSWSEGLIYTICKGLVMYLRVFLFLLEFLSLPCV